MLSLTPARFSDNGFIKSVFAAALPLYQTLMPGSFEANLANMDILTEKGLDFSATGLEGWILAAEVPLGFAGIGSLNPRQAYMAALYFLPSHQRQGYGCQALQLLEADYAAQGYSEMLLLVHHQAHWAVNFYTKADYRQISTDPAAIVAYGGEQLGHLIEADLVLMAKTLANSDQDSGQTSGQANGQPFNPPLSKG